MRGDRTEWEGLRILCGVVADYQDVAMSSTALFQRPHNVHGNPPKRCRDDKERLQGALPRWDTALVFWQMAHVLQCVCTSVYSVGQ